MSEKRGQNNPVQFKGIESLLENLTEKLDEIHERRNEAKHPKHLSESRKFYLISFTNQHYSNPRERIVTLAKE